jgi:hypothetical protein
LVTQLLSADSQYLTVGNVAIDKLCQETVQKWLKDYAGELATSDEASLTAHNEVRNLAAIPELAPISYPATIHGKQAYETWKTHVYVADDGLFHAKFNGSEA